jgi:hypothetical protein
MLPTFTLYPDVKPDTSAKLYLYIIFIRQLLLLINLILKFYILYFNKTLI